jgi:hypothetical protein
VWVPLTYAYNPLFEDHPAGGRAYEQAPRICLVAPTGAGRTLCKAIGYVDGADGSTWQQRAPAGGAKGNAN